jgi:preprotein translocase subunit SecG
MGAIIVILLVIVCAVLAFFVLIQNPKGGGLAGSFGGLGNQMMGVKQSTDVVEKGTWVTYIAMVVLILLSFMIAPKTSTKNNDKLLSEKAVQGMSAPAPVAPAPPAAATTTAPATEQGGTTATQPATAPAQQQAAPTGKTMTKEEIEAAMKQATKK